MRKILLLVTAVVLGLVSNAQAFNELQLDIAGGTYSGTSPTGNITPETILAPANSFKLYAYLQKNGGQVINQVTDLYYLSAAVVPMQAQTTTPPSLGSFNFNNTSYNVTGAMVYGAPPVEALLTRENNDLQTHGVFETYFKEFSFQFDPTRYVEQYDTQTRAIAGGSILTAPDPARNPKNMYVMTFDVDVSGLAAGYGIHFDLYNTELASATDLAISQKGFAPFSHDAEGWRRGGGGGGGQETPVPEPGTFVLLGSGLLGMGLLGRRLRNMK
jgi:hypothetical protein